jgi:hypothetical protein
MQNRLIQTSQTGGQQYSDTSRFSIPCERSSLLRRWGNKDKIFCNVDHRSAENSDLLEYIKNYQVASAIKLLCL